MHLYAAPSHTPLHVDGRQFRDAAGRQVILKGINVSGHAMKGPVVSRNDLVRIRDWGFNSIRYVMGWSALEPVCGRYDEAAFECVAQCLRWAEELGLFVLLDMHQDLWSAPPGGGMPEWTTIDVSQEHVSDGPNWSAAYFQSPWVQTAFDNFWLNSPGPDGVGLQDRFALVWQEVARRFTNAPNLIGYDLLNEPFPGTPILDALHAATAAVLPSLDPADLVDRDEFELGLLAFDATGGHPALFDAWLSAMAPISEDLDRTRLRPMQQRVAVAIRAVDRRHAICLEPFLTTNAGVIPQCLRWDNEASGQSSQLVFAPHIYEADPSKVTRTTQKLLALAATEAMPILFGEWGNLDNSDGMYTRDPYPGTRGMLRLLEGAGASTMYWVYSKGLDRDPFFAEFLQRPSPRAISGRMHGCRFDPEKPEFTCSWHEDPLITAASEFVIPAAHFSAGISVTIEPEGAPWRIERIGSDSPNAVLSIPPHGRQVSWMLTLRPAT